MVSFLPSKHLVLYEEGWQLPSPAQNLQSSKAMPPLYPSQPIWRPALLPSESPVLGEQFHLKRVQVMPQGWPEDECPFQPHSVQWLGQVSRTCVPTLCQELRRVILVELLQVGHPGLLRLSPLEDPGAVCGSWSLFGEGV